MRKSFVLCSLLLVICSLGFAQQYPPGVKLIYTARELAAVGAGDNCVLMNDIDLRGVEWTPICAAIAHVRTANTFGGVFDGNGYTISNLTINSTEDNQGLFAEISAGGTVKNLGLVNVNIATTGSGAGALAGRSTGRIENCFATGSVRAGEWAGGLAGSSAGHALGQISPAIKNCWTNVTVSSVDNRAGFGGAGGIIGYLAIGQVEYCYALGTVTSENGKAGGIAGLTLEKDPAAAIITVRNCVALNPAIRGTASARIVNDAISAGNYGRNTMTVNNSTVNGTGKRDRNGMNIVQGTAAGQFNNKDFWEYSAYFSFNVWEWSAAQQLPVLRGLRGQAPALAAAAASGPASTVPALPAIINIGSAADLAKIGTPGYPLNGIYKLTANIDLRSHSPWRPIGIGIPFSGVFDGCGYTISNLSINSTLAVQGLFAESKGVIKNVGLSNVNVTAWEHTGSLVGENFGVVESCFAVGGTVTGGNVYTGGLVGLNDSADAVASIGGVPRVIDVADIRAGVYNCWTDLTVIATIICVGGGGVVGGVENAEAENCYALGVVYNTGGVVGAFREPGGDGRMGSRNLVALNPYVQSGSGRKGGRVGAAPGSPPKNAYGRDTMIFYRAMLRESEMVNSTNHGICVSRGTLPGQYHSRSFWQYKAGFNFFGPWEWSETYLLPVLRGVRGQAPSDDLPLPRYTATSAAAAGLYRGDPSSGGVRITSVPPNDIDRARDYLMRINDRAIGGEGGDYKPSENDKGIYYLVIDRDVNVEPQAFVERTPLFNANTGQYTYYFQTGNTLVLIGTGGNRTVNLSSNGPLFQVGRGFTLVLGNNITLRGRANNVYPLVYIEYGGTLVMEAGSKITGNTAAGDYASAVHTEGGGMLTSLDESRVPGVSGGGADAIWRGGGRFRSLFIMRGGEISGNASANNAAVALHQNTLFIMSGGEIKDNRSGGTAGAVRLSDSMFAMSGGSISGNTAAGLITAARGNLVPAGLNNTAGLPIGAGGIEINGSMFAMSGGRVNGNTSAGAPIDIQIGPDDSLVLSGSAAPGIARLASYQQWNYSPNFTSCVTLNNWTGQGPVTLHLENASSWDQDSINNWLNRDLLIKTAGALTAAEAAKFTLGRLYTGNARAGQPIPNTERIASSGAAIGKLTTTRQLFTVTATAGPNGLVTAPGGIYERNETATVKAQPDPRYSFEGWYEGETRVSTNETYTFAVTANRALQARFHMPQYTVTVTAGTGGTVTGGGSFSYNATPTVRAAESPGYRFDGWYEGDRMVSTSLSYQVTVTANRALQARFTAISGYVASNVPAGFGELAAAAMFEVIDAGSYRVVRNANATLPEKLAIPAVYNRRAVTEIGSPTDKAGAGAFSNRRTITDVIIPDSVTSIGRKAFENCSALKSVTIGNGVTTIGDYAFDFCTALESITIPSSVRSIGDYAFTNCRGLKSITIPDGVTSIGEWAFYICSVLESITIPASVKEIGSSAFASCSAITSITIAPGSAITTGRRELPGGLGDVYSGPGTYTRPDGNSKAWMKDGAPAVPPPPRAATAADFTYTETATAVTITGYSGPEGINLVIPERINNKPVTAIADGRTSWYGVFASKRLTGVTIPSTVTSIGDWAFFVNQLASLTIPNSVTAIGDGAFRNNQLASLTIPNSVTAIGEEAFGNNQLASLTIPDSVTAIGKEAFWRNRLTSVIIGSGVRTIGATAFGDNQLTSITIGANVTLGNTITGDARFNTAYNNGGKLAGTYTRANATATAWTRR